MSLITVSAALATKLPSGEAVPVLGQGTWGMAEGAHPRQQEIETLRVGLDLGMSLIDTAEMYANGRAEELVGDAIASRREEVFLVSKVLPDNASRTVTSAACERSLRRLKTDWLDIYLLHWRGRIRLQDTIDAFEVLVRSGKIRYWGVSNFDFADMQELEELCHGRRVAVDQVLYNLSRRGIEYDLLPWCRKHEIPIMAYSPIEQGRLLNGPELRKVANQHRATPAQVALAWVLRQDGVIAIPRAGTPEHVRENQGALAMSLSSEDLRRLDRAFPPPDRSRRLEML